MCNAPYRNPAQLEPEPPQAPRYLLTYPQPETPRALADVYRDLDQALVELTLQAAPDLIWEACTTVLDHAEPRRPPRFRQVTPDNAGELALALIWRSYGKSWSGQGPGKNQDLSLDLLQRAIGRAHDWARFSAASNHRETELARRGMANLLLLAVRHITDGDELLGRLRGLTLRAARERGLMLSPEAPHA